MINDTTMVQALVDNGCLCTGVINDTLATEMNLPRIRIIPRPLQTADKSNTKRPMIESITNISLDLDGLVMHKIWLYIVPNCTHEMILGKKWLEDQDAVVHSKDQRLELRKQKFSINSVRRWRQNLRNVARPKYTTAEAMAFMVDTVPVFKASLEDISKALRDKPKLSGSRQNHVSQTRLRILRDYSQMKMVLRTCHLREKILTMQ